MTTRVRYRDAVVRTANVVPDVARFISGLPSLWYPGKELATILAKLDADAHSPDKIDALRAVWTNALMSAAHHLYALDYPSGDVAQVLREVLRIREKRGFHVDAALLHHSKAHYTGSLAANRWLSDDAQAPSSITIGASVAPFLAILAGGGRLTLDEIQLIVEVSKPWWMPSDEPGYGRAGFFMRDPNGMSIFSYLIYQMSDQHPDWVRTFLGEEPARFALIDPSIFYRYGQAIAAGDRKAAEQYAAVLDRLFERNIDQMVKPWPEVTNCEYPVLLHVPEAASGTTGFLHYVAVRHGRHDLLTHLHILNGSESALPITYVLPSLPFGEEIEETVNALGGIEPGVRRDPKRRQWEPKVRQSYVQGAARGGATNEAAGLSQLWPAMYFYSLNKLSANDRQKILNDPYAIIERRTSKAKTEWPHPASEDPIPDDDMTIFASIAWAQPWLAHHAPKTIYDALHLLREINRFTPMTSKSISTNVNESVARVALQRLASAAATMPIPAGLDADYAVATHANIGFDPALIRAMTSTEGIVPAVIAPRFESIVYQIDRLRDHETRCERSPGPEL